MRPIVVLFGVETPLKVYKCIAELLEVNLFRELTFSTTFPVHL
jgi:hypothetical protein